MPLALVTPTDANGATVMWRGPVWTAECGMPMRQECKTFESRTYPNGETVRKCHLDLAPDAPWRCPDNCPKYERRMDAGWTYGTVVPPMDRALRIRPKGSAKSR